MSENLEVIGTKSARRADGICPACGIRPRMKHSYCTRCSNQRRRELRAGLRAAQQPEACDRHGLTDRQKEILALLDQGCVLAQIAKRRGVGVRQIKAIKSRIVELSGCINAFQLGAWAVRQGLV